MECLQAQKRKMNPEAKFTDLSLDLFKRICSFKEQDWKRYSACCESEKECFDIEHDVECECCLDELSSLGRKSCGRTRRAKARKHRLVATAAATAATAATTTAVHNGAPTTTSTTTSNNNIIGSGKASSDESFSDSEGPQTRGGYFHPIQQGSADSALAAHSVHSIEEKLGETRDDQLSSNMVSLSRVSVVPLLSRNPPDTSRERERDSGRVCR